MASHSRGDLQHVRRRSCWIEIKKRKTKNDKLKLSEMAFYKGAAEATGQGNFNGSFVRVRCCKCV